MNTDTKNETNQERSPRAGTPESPVYQRMMKELNAHLNPYPYLKYWDGASGDVYYSDNLPMFLLRIACAINPRYSDGTDPELKRAAEEYISSPKHAKEKSFTGFIFLGLASAIGCHKNREKGEDLNEVTKQEFERQYKATATGTARKIENLFKIRAKDKDYAAEILAIDLGGVKKSYGETAAALVAEVQRKLGAIPQGVLPIDVALDGIAKKLYEPEARRNVSPPDSQAEAPDAVETSATEVAEPGFPEFSTEAGFGGGESEATETRRDAAPATETRRDAAPAEIAEAVSEKVAAAVREVVLFAVPCVAIVGGGLLCAALSGDAAAIVGNLWFPTVAIATVALFRIAPKSVAKLLKEFRK